MVREALEGLATPAERLFRYVVVVCIERAEASADPPLLCLCETFTRAVAGWAVSQRAGTHIRQSGLVASSSWRLEVAMTEFQQINRLHRMQHIITGAFVTFGLFNVVVTALTLSHL